MLGVWPEVVTVPDRDHVKCPDCGKEIRIFGESRLEREAAIHGIAGTASIPIDPLLSAACDRGEIESFKGDWLEGIFDALPKAK